MGESTDALKEFHARIKCARLMERDVVMPADVADTVLALAERQFPSMLQGTPDRLREAHTVIVKERDRLAAKRDRMREGDGDYGEGMLEGELTGIGFALRELRKHLQ